MTKYTSPPQKKSGEKRNKLNKIGKILIAAKGRKELYYSLIMSTTQSLKENKQLNGFGVNSICALSYQ